MLIIYTRVRIVKLFVCANCVHVYRRLGFDCVVKRLRMSLYKPDCDFNDCELPSRQYNYELRILFPAILLIANYGKTRNSQ